MATDKIELFLVDRDEQVTLGLNGQTGNIFAGGKGHDGDLLLLNKAGETAVHIDGEAAVLKIGAPRQSGSIEVKDAFGTVAVRLDGKNGNIVAGGLNHDGDIILLDEKVRARMILEAFDASIELKDELGQVNLRLDGERSDIKMRFEPSTQTPVYQTVEQVAEFFAKKGYLPGMPSPMELKEDGIWLRDFMFKMLRQVEQLTAIVIEQQREIEDLKAAI